MLIHKDKMMFRNCNKFLNTEKGKEAQKDNDGYRKLKNDIKEKGIINPILCIEENNMYKICIGMRRFIAGLDLGMTEFEVKVLPNDDIPLLQKEKQQYRHTDVQ
jgi:ParB-like chromosome segregation protein Spo0J|tara:strand:- start:322 stop:633 length:312 start_codon:yes stop_codon:yes gene_type:complete